ncbi:MAG: Gfo/Idh/MocA family oxidoreductase [Chitinophagaceae bacterium]|nr:Gfo/Idh/MocA family oxidoreductase [Chitinophagaceae bacterium]
MSSDKKFGVALVGLGYYSTHQLAPALLQTEHCYLAGVVTGSPKKIPVWKEKYSIPENNIYNYNNFDEIISNPTIDIVYIVLPNHLHAAYTIRGFEAGKHVICEKPMALSVAECDAMIAASEKADKNLSVGYRLHFDPYNREMIRLAKEKVYGQIKSIDTAFCITPQKGEWRLDKNFAGGGPLMDVGIYCLQAVCYVTGQNPVAVTAQSFPASDKEKFKDIEETITWQMEMPGGLVASCRTSYSEQTGYIKIIAENGWFELNPAFNYDGLKINTSDGRSFNIPAFSQQVKQLDGIALSVKNNQRSSVPGTMGRRDMKIIAAVYEAMQTGKRIEIKY